MKIKKKHYTKEKKYRKNLSALNALNFKSFQLKGIFGI